MALVTAAFLLGSCSNDSPSGPSDPEPWPIGDALCQEGTEFDTGNSFYVDPANGDDTNDGSQSQPWQSIQYVLDTYVDCVDRDGAPHHTDAPVQGGDTIYLVGASGHDQELEISGCYNDTPVRVKALNRHEPQVASLHFRGSANWRFEGLAFVNDSAGLMIRIEDHDTRGEAYDIEIFDNYLTSGDLNTLQEYTDFATDGIRVLNGAASILIRCNTMYKVAQAMTISGSNHQVLGNLVEFFTRDGIATGGSHNRFIGNRIFNAIDLGDGHHDDFFQSHMGANPDTSSDVEIAYNLFANLYPADQPPETWSPTQCLSAFEDGPKQNIRIYNNVCRTDHYHGITWYDTHNSLVVNNTVIGGTDMPGLPAGSEEWPSHSWISVEGDGNIVRNNLVTLNQSGGDHNLELVGDDVYDYFVNWDDRTAALELLPTAPAVNGGVADQAPTDDILGRTRDDPPDVGAYELAP